MAPIMKAMNTASINISVIVESPGCLPDRPLSCRLLEFHIDSDGIGFNVTIERIGAGWRTPGGLWKQPGRREIQKIIHV
jgi:hypothetical protein